MAVLCALRRTSTLNIRQFVPITSSLVHTFYTPAGAKLHHLVKEPDWGFRSSTSNSTLAKSTLEQTFFPIIAHGLSTNAEPEPDSSATQQKEEEDLNMPKKQPDLVYEGTLASTVWRVKVLSVISCFMTTAGAPVIVGLSRPDLSPSMQVATATTLACFGLFTTGILQWYISPYIMKMSVLHNDDPYCVTKKCSACDVLYVTRLNMFARQVTDEIMLTEVVPTDTYKPLATFQVKKRVYFFDKAHWNPDLHQKTLNEIMELSGNVEEEIEEEDSEESDKPN